MSAGCYYADHQFYHKWAVLLDPRDTAAGPKGFVKCDIAVCERGVTIRVSQLYDICLIVLYCISHLVTVNIEH